MSKNDTCPTCDQAIPASHAFFVGQAIEQASTWGTKEAWDEWYTEGEGYCRNVPGLGLVTLIAKTPKLGESQGDDDRPVFMIFEFGGRFFRKNGIADSYGEFTWYGPFKDAKQVVREIKEWQ